ncbi:MAG: sigma-70 family RNA polymerase sigma factor [Planctomycetota bacterium]
MTEKETVLHTDEHEKDRVSEALWRRLADSPGDKDITGQLVTAYWPLVQSELSRARFRLPRHVDVEELEASGLEALFFAIRDFDPGLSTDFEAYARKRVWGAILDRVRRLDGIPRTALRAAKTLTKANIAFAQRCGRWPTVEELAEELGISAEELTRLERQALVSNKLSLDAIGEAQLMEDSDEPLEAFTDSASVNSSPLTSLADAETKALLVEGLKALPERERSILVLYYHEGIMFTEIAAAMEISEPRVSQIHARALERLKQFLVSRDRSSLCAEIYTSEAET